MLLKVWLRQRGFGVKTDSFNGFMMSFLVSHLLKTKIVNKFMSSYQIFRMTLQFIGKKFLLFFSHFFSVNKLKNGVFTDDSLDDDVKTSFKSNFEVVFVDCEAKLNLTHRMTSSSLLELEEECRKSISYLKGTSSDDFEALFMIPLQFCFSYDYFVR